MSRIFIDTNFLVYLNDDDAPAKRDRAEQLWSDLSNSADIAIVSTQVLQEYYNSLVQKLKVKPIDAKAKLQVLSGMSTVLMNPAIIYSATDIHAADKTSFWDALIVAAAQSAGCDEVWSEDLQDGRAFGSLVIRNPFKGL